MSSDEEDEDVDSHTHAAATAAFQGSAQQHQQFSSHNASFRGSASLSGSAAVSNNNASVPTTAAGVAARDAVNYAKKTSAQATGQEFIIQLATTRKMLLNMLEKHDAVPDKVCANNLHKRSFILLNFFFHFIIYFFSFHSFLHTRFTCI